MGEAPAQKQAAPAVTADAIYDAYPRKEARRAAVRAIEKAIRDVAKHGPLDGHESAESYLLERTKAYADAVARWPRDDRRFIPHPATWFNGERYKDAENAWLRRVVGTPVESLRGPDGPQGELYRKF